MATRMGEKKDRKKKEKIIKLYTHKENIQKSLGEEEKNKNEKKNRRKA